MPTETSSTSSNPNFLHAVQPVKLTLPPTSNHKPVDTIAQTDSVESPIESYESNTGRPFLVDLMDLSQIYGRTSQDKEIEKINQYVLDQIIDRNLQSTKSNYRTLIDEIKSNAYVSDSHDYTEQLKKMSIYVYALMERKNREDLMRVVQANI